MSWCNAIRYARYFVSGASRLHQIASVLNPKYDIPTFRPTPATAGMGPYVQLFIALLPLVVAAQPQRREPELF